MIHWQRPPGPLNVWRIIEGYERLKDGTKKDVKFSIQEIPNDDKRRQEVLDHMFDYFLTSEPISIATKVKENSKAIQDYYDVWNYALDQGAVVGCYKLDSDGRIQELIGANMVFMVTEDTAKDLAHLKENFKSQDFKNVWRLFEVLVENADVRKIYKVDKFISSVCLSVSPEYRGQSLGRYILEARNEMGKKYGFPATSTMFTAITSQTQAKRAGFEEFYTLDYADFLNDDGSPVFPDHPDLTCAKIMMKRLP